MNQEKSMFELVKGVRTFEEVASRIKKLVFEGTLKAGDKLPPEAQLARQFNVGRQTVREALRMLELSGFISTQRGGGGGTFIKNAIPSRIGEMFSDAFRMQSVNLSDLTEARLEIERLIMEFALDNANSDDLEALRQNVAAARENIAQGKMATEYNSDFHILLARATHNEVYVIVTRSLMAVHMELLSRVDADLETSAGVVAAHEEILAAMIKRDRPLARRLLERHVREVRDRVDQLHGLERREP